MHPWLGVSVQDCALPVPQLLCSPDVTLRITFADAASVPRLVRLEHAPSPTAAFGRLGDIMLQPKSLKQLRHLFRCGRVVGSPGWAHGSTHVSPMQTASFMWPAAALCLKSV